MRTVFHLLAVLAVASAGSSQAQSPPSSETGPRLRFNGDFRLRYERTTAANGTPSTGKEVVRFRIGVSSPLREDLMVRARLATGSPGDPNSTDVTLGQFVDDLAVSLDLAWVEWSRSRWGVFGGKLINPFLTTELLWDGDVNPQGIGGRLILGSDARLKGTLTALYAVVDQQAGDSSSDMGGGQLALTAPVGKAWRVTAAGAFYDYRIRSLATTDAGDIRGNRLAPGGARYLSDFDLLDALVAVDHTGFGERFPLRILGDYVRNFGADGSASSAWEADLYLGRTQEPGDTRFRYGFALVETDAVLAAFAHDNTTLGTNSETHTLAVDAIATPGLLLNGTLYVYRPHELPAGEAREYQTRLRLNATVMF